MDPALMNGQARQGEAGFGLVESLIAVMLLAFGLLAVAAAFSQGLKFMSGATLDILAREKAAEAIESVYTARDTRTVTWDEVRNVQGETGADGGVFEDGPQPLTRPGADGLLNTADDPEDPEVLMGADGVLGTEDDIELTQFTREIEIREIGPNLRRIRVVIRYFVGPDERRYELVSLISSYA
jgi:type II secretory pathway pseudopilin PulG